MPDEVESVIPALSGTEECVMPADLPSEVAGLLVTETVGNIQANNRDGRNLGSIAMGVLQAAAARNFDKLGAVESRAVSGVLATPVAAPTTGGTP